MKKIFLFILLAITTQMMLGQTDYTNCNYNYSDLNISLSGWNASRLDYTDVNFRNSTSLPSRTNFVDAESHVTSEFGYPFFTYKFRENIISFSGVIFDQAQGYNGQNQLNHFIIKDDTFDVNGLKVGDSITTLNSQFSGLCHNSSENYYLLLYGSIHSLVFYYDANTNTINSIEYNTMK
jgi:hypothetical protein